MVQAFLAAVTLGAAWAGPLQDPGRAPAWLARMGLSHDGQGWVYERRHSRREARARRRLEPGEVSTLDAFLAGIPEADREAALARPLLDWLEERRLPPADSVFFDRVQGELSLTPVGWMAIAGVVVGDPFGDKFQWPPEEPETPFSKPIRLTPWLLPESPREPPAGGGSPLFDGAAGAGGQREESAAAAPVEALASRLERPVLTSRETKESFLAQITLPKTPPRWHTMDMTRSQWERWQSKALMWQENPWVRAIYQDDVQRYYGRPSGREFVAMADVILTAFHARNPNLATEWLLWAARTYDDISRKLPVQFRDELGDYFKRRWEGRVDADLPSGIAQAAGLNTSDSGLDLPLFWGRLKTLWEQLHPRLNLKINPRFDMKDPSAKLGVGVRMDWRDWLRIRMSGAYDTRDRVWMGIGAIGADW